MSNYSHLQYYEYCNISDVAILLLTLLQYDYVAILILLLNIIPVVILWILQLQHVKVIRNVLLKCCPTDSLCWGHQILVTIDDSEREDTAASETHTNKFTRKCYLEVVMGKRLLHNAPQGDSGRNQGIPQEILRLWPPVGWPYHVPGGGAGEPSPRALGT